MALFQAVSGFLPFGAIDDREFLSRNRMPGVLAWRREDADGTAHETRPGEATLRPVGAPLMVSV